MNQKIKNIIISIPFTVSVYLMLRKLKAIPIFTIDYIKFISKTDNRFSINTRSMMPILLEKTSTTNFEPHYIYHPAWAARIIAKNKPTTHTDISSTLHFSSIVSAFVPVDFYDYRPAKLNLSNLKSKHVDLTNLPFPDNSISSLSCMHVVEHIGLGRYGDPIDPKGDLKSIAELKRVLAHNGSLIFVVPVGKPRIQFNAHRIYSYEQILECFSDLELKEFSMIPDNFRETGIIYNADPNFVKEQNWGCGCFWFIKK